MSRKIVGRKSLRARWLDLVRCWTGFLRYTWEEIWERIGFRERIDRKRSTLLDIQLLEIRELPVSLPEMFACLAA